MSNSFSCEVEKKRQSSSFIHVIEILREGVKKGKVSLFFRKFVFVFALAKKRFENGC